ncbi:MAG TPA: amidohydrolase family protein [Bryobacteraceae bacterium]|nr:amidohydrolase family protein [Bryobacteraceae bacterium]
MNESRRTFLAGMAGIAAQSLNAQPAPIPIIDTHIHLFDTTRPQGVPYPDKNNATLYKPAFPDRYRKIAQPLGIVGAIEVEASPWIEDNLWVLDVAAKDTIIVGTVGDLEPGKPEFPEYLERYHRNPLFRGIRYGNLWGRNISSELSKPEFIAGLKLLADAGLVLDTANPRPELIEAMVRVSDRVPNLRIVIDHLPQLDPPSESAALKQYDANLRELAKRPQVYVKISEVLRRVNGRVPTDLNFYRPRLDQLYGIFGEDHVLYGSDWPNSDNWLPYEIELSVVREYFTGKGRAAAEKYFWKNSIAAYRWIRRDPSQPQA